MGGDLPGFDTPTLKGVCHTPPYFHDGSAKSLHDTLNVPGHGNAQNLSNEEKDLLVSYLLQLDENPQNTSGNPDEEPQPEPEPQPTGGSVDMLALLLLSLLAAARKMNIRRRD